MSLYVYPATPISLPAGGATSANQATEIAQLTAINANTSPTVIDQLDSVLVDTSSTNIPGSASSPLQVVASLAAPSLKVVVVEDIGEYYGIYTGAPASEVLAAVVPLGGGEFELKIPASTRVSLRSLTASAISVGKIAINFEG